MGLYVYENPKTGETVEVFQKMTEPHVYVKKGVTWKRVWLKPQASIDTHVDAHSAKDFVKVTNRGGTVGDLWDRSAELSAKRADKEGGRDPIREAYLDKFEKTHKGTQHPVRKREQGAKKLKDAGISVDWGD